MLVEPAQATDQLFLPPVPPQLEVILLDRVDPKLRLLARANALGPGVPQESIRQQPELQRLRGGERHPAALRAKPGLLKDDVIVARGQINPDAARRTGMGRDRVTARTEELDGHIGNRDVPLVTHISNQRHVSIHRSNAASKKTPATGRAGNRSCPEPAARDARIGNDRWKSSTVRNPPRSEQTRAARQRTLRRADPASPPAFPWCLRALVVKPPPARQFLLSRFARPGISPPPFSGAAGPGSPS